MRQLETRLDKYFSLFEMLFHRLVPKHELWSVSDVILQGPVVANAIEPPHSNFMVDLSCPYNASPQSFFATTNHQRPTRLDSPYYAARGQLMIDVLAFCL